MVSRAFDDQLSLDLAARLSAHEPHESRTATYPIADAELAVFGAHMRHQPLNDELIAAGARFAHELRTVPSHRLHARRPVPAEAGAVPVDGDGDFIVGELWQLSFAALGALLTKLPAPLMLGSVELENGHKVVGLGCAPAASDVPRDNGVRVGVLRHEPPVARH